MSYYILVEGSKDRQELYIMERRGMSKLDSSYYDIYDEFVNTYPEREKNIVSWRPDGRFGIILKFKDGMRTRFDINGKHLRRIRSAKSVATSYVPEDEWRQEFAKILKIKMFEEHVNQSILASRVGCSQVCISNYVNGSRTPSVYILEKIAEALNCHPSYFYEYGK